ncbi:hypothetical protein B1813_13020 [Saccharomonospora piscinae]|uniref:Tyr recombinase domain-containing protein n=1 Tax=Saccharomonospora piscinae TaxID=687388 RepID=A0A1V9A7A4_SACPI|nr:hypothetical protein B1813_13020 [Saccharomonospora piscinae]
MFRKIRGRDEFLWVTSHTFRKTTATTLDGPDLPTRLVAAHLGHARPQMTQDSYLAAVSTRPPLVLWKGCLRTRGLAQERTHLPLRWAAWDSNPEPMD